MKVKVDVRGNALTSKQTRRIAPCVKGATAINSLRKRIFKTMIARVAQWGIAIMMVSSLCWWPAKAVGIPGLNNAIYLSWGGYVDTTADFASFFDSDHTLVTWFMPQYVHAYKGPIFANSGSGTYFFGMEDYRLGDGGVLDPGSPVMLLQVGDQQKTYLVPKLYQNVWHHLAVVRAEGVFSVYLDGDKLTPVLILDRKSNLLVHDDELQLTDSVADYPKGTLRFGRQSTSLETSTQAYGLLDDVAVFDRALLPTEIDSIRNGKRLTGDEDGLKFGWCFDTGLRWESRLPPSLDSDATYSPRAIHVSVSPDRSTFDDSEVYYASFLPSSISESLQLPFKANEAWKVVQGYDSKGGSHNGFAAFCYDFVLANSAGLEYPNGTFFAPVYSASGGIVAHYVKDGGYNWSGQERNVVDIKTGPNEFLSYLHNQANSISSVLDTGICNSKSDCVFRFGGAPSVKPGDFLAKVGFYAKHLHFAALNRLNSGKVTFPVPFDNYYVSTDQGVTWTYVPRGYPRRDDWIKRIN